MRLSEASIKSNLIMSVVLLCALLALSIFVIHANTASYAEKSKALEGELNGIISEYEDLSYKYFLAIEFSFDPLIVELVEAEAAKVFADTQGEFRLIRTPEYLAYLFLSLIYVESKGNVYAVGDNGKARGLTQIWTTTAKAYDEEITPEALFDPQTNIRLGFRHFVELLRHYKGNFALALYGWNRGQSRVDKLIAYGTVENGYGAKVYQAALVTNGRNLN